MLQYCSMLTYLEQLEAKASVCRVPLEAACKAEGVAATTLLRWRKGQTHPREDTTRALIARLERMAAQAA